MPSGWALKPSGLNDGDKFRLLFITSTTRDATATDIGTYNTFVQTNAKTHSAISNSCGNLFKVVGSTATVDARDNAGTTGTGVAIHWLGGVKAADNYTDFHDGSWDSSFGRVLSSPFNANFSYFSGSNFDGTGFSGDELGTTGTHVRAGDSNQGLAGGSRFSKSVSSNFLAISPVFRVGTPPSGSLTFSTTSVQVLEGATETYTVVLDTRPTGRVRVTPSSDNLDVTFTPARLTFNASGSSLWSTPQTVTVNAGQDDDGVDDTATISHSASGGGYDSVTGDVGVEVSDNDSAALVFSRTLVSVTEGGRATYSVRLRMEPTGPVTVTPARSGSSDVTFSPATLSFTTTNWSDAQTVTVRAREDGDTQPDTATLSHSASGGGYGSVTGTVQVAVADNDVEGPVVTIERISSGSVTEGAQVGFKVKTSALPEKDALSVAVTVSQPAGSDFLAFKDVINTEYYQVTFFPSHVPYSGEVGNSGKGERELWIWTENDDRDEPSGNLTVTVAPGAGYGYFFKYNVGAPSSARVEVRDDDFGPLDAAPCLNCVWATTSDTNINKGDTVTFTVHANPAPDRDLPVAVRVSDAPQSGDFLDRREEGIREVTIAAGTTSKSFTVPTRSDAIAGPYQWITAQAMSQARAVDTRRITFRGLKDPGAPFGRAEARVNVRRFAGLTLLPVVSMMNAVPVVEGEDVVFTFVAVPQPGGTLDAPLQVGVTIEATGGDYGIESGERTVTIPTTGIVTLRLPTDDDDVDDAEGWLSATLKAGEGYLLGDVVGNAINILDNDEPLPAGHPVMKYASLVKSFHDRLTDRNQHGDGAAGGWNKRFLKAMGHPEYVAYPQAAVTVADATRIWNHGGDGANTAWDGTVAAVTYAEQYFAGQTPPTPTAQQQQVPDPEITITAGAGVTEGAGAVFTVTADRAPDANLAVTLNVAEAQGSDFVAASDEGTKTVTVLAGETTATLTVATDNDGVDEPDGSVTATVQAGTGYTVGTASSGTVAIADDDEPVTPVVDNTLPAAHPVMKHASVVKRFYDRITASNQHGDGAAGGWNKRFLKAMGHPDYVDYPQAAVTVADATSLWNHGGPGANTAWDGTVAAVTYAEQYFAGQVTTEEQNTPDPVPVPEIAIAAGAGVTEGGDATFTLTATPPPAAPLEVTVTVATDGDYGITAGERTVTIPTTGAYTLTLATTGDDADEPDGSVTATVTAGSGYTVGTASTGTVAIADDDAAGALPVLSVESKSVQEGDRLVLWATIDPFPSKADFPELYRTTRLKLSTIEGTAWDGVDYVGIPAHFGVTEVCSFHTTLAPNGKHGCRIDEVTILDDSHDDGGETFQLEVGFADSEPAPLRSLGEVRGTITIENSDPLPAAYLARFGRTVAEQALDGIAGRMSASRTPGMQGTIAGQALSFDPTGGPDGSGAANGHAGMGGGAGLSDNGPGPAFSGSMSGAGGTGLLLVLSEFDTPADRFGGGHGPGEAYGLGESRTMTARDALLGSSFSLTGEQDGAGGSLAFWGRASQGSFDGVERGDGTDIRLDGTVTTGMLGADYARGDWLVGLALTQSASEGEYAALGGDPCPGTDASLCDGAVRAGEVEASLTAAIPYAALEASERLKLWGSAGYGTGEVTLKTAMGDRYRADTTWTMAAAGLRGDLLEAPTEGSGPALALTSDALWARTSSEKTRDLAASESDVTRLRLGLEGSYRLALEGDGHLTPKLELGARHDGGDAETGFGVELGGGARLERSGARSLARRLGPHVARARGRRPRGPGRVGGTGLRPRPGDAAGPVAQPAPGAWRAGAGRSGRAVQSGPARGPHGQRGREPLVDGGGLRCPGVRRALHRQPTRRARALYGRTRLQPRLAADPGGSGCARPQPRGQGDPPGERHRRAGAHRRGRGHHALVTAAPWTPATASPRLDAAPEARGVRGGAADACRGVGARTAPPRPSASRGLRATTRSAGGSPRRGARPAAPSMSAAPSARSMPPTRPTSAASWCSWATPCERHRRRRCASAKGPAGHRAPHRHGHRGGMPDLSDSRLQPHHQAARYSDQHSMSARRFSNRSLRA